MKNTWKKIVSACCLMSVMTGATAGNELDGRVLKTMKTATKFMMEKVSYKGGFVWNYLPDLSRSWGELEAKRTMVWIQPPGTPSVGHLLLDVYHATGDEYYYEAAKQVANALIWGQLDCGGWNYVFDYAGENSLKEWWDIMPGAWRNSNIIMAMPPSMTEVPFRLVSSCSVCMWRRTTLLSDRLWRRLSSSSWTANIRWAVGRNAIR